MLIDQELLEQQHHQANVSTGFGNTIKDYIYLPIFIIALALVIFRKHFVYFVMHGKSCFCRKFEP